MLRPETLNLRKRRFPVLLAVIWLLATTVLPSACKKADSTGSAPLGSASSSAHAPQKLLDGPPPKSKGRTTDGSIAMGNLNGEISSFERFVSQPKTPLERRRRLIDLLKVRGDMAGRIADIERASEMAENLVRDFPDKPEAYLARAGMRAAFHRFDDAVSDLDAAEKHGASAAQTRAKRASILMARGRFEDALPLVEQQRTERPSIDSLGMLGVLQGELGRRSEAISNFREAFAVYPDTSPFPVAWLFFAQGQFWEREGNIDLALSYHRACLERLPVHAHAAAHLARLDKPEAAEGILKPLLETSDDPELRAVLAGKLELLGDGSRAKEYRTAAAVRYDELVAKHPEAFADHAAQFWLDVGGDAKKALELAQRNLSWRKTPKAYELAVVAALAAHERGVACEMGTEALKLPQVTAMFRGIVNDACEKR